MIILFCLVRLNCVINVVLTCIFQFPPSVREVCGRPINFFHKILLRREHLQLAPPVLWQYELLVWVGGGGGGGTNGRPSCSVFADSDPVVPFAD